MMSGWSVGCEQYASFADRASDDSFCQNSPFAHPRLPAGRRHISALSKIHLFKKKVPQAFPANLIQSQRFVEIVIKTAI